MQNILLVEDDPFLIDIYTTKLKESGFSVEVANDGEVALRKARENKPDLVILDIVLPQIDGWEILRKIKSEPEFKNLKVIILSNLGQKEEVEKGMKLGAIKYLIKAHYTPSQVIKEIKKTI
ncbi:MAG: response regulator [Candidatus Nealsonbacteria bacterium CG_4_10_14_0_2_um_filter_40_15]|uniref:Response regulator n=2 Tax=Candidatus Nealsoniibacteriota TaxID=1817911 RepID=A0A2M7D8L2_9BACT|nr:MAG: response regulator [Candidatus Nealsonbacteria bacterium CG02_land_8_20_14_3_00_40_11]PIZ86838.1 MAG: response regulator [Candidatus Nealsonbacteria bacterium CG_4_10_14_0_2_um_filter_40_15]